MGCCFVKAVVYHGRGDLRVEDVPVPEPGRGEMLVRVEGDRVRTRPIAGTRARGADEESDLRQEDDLRRDPKEPAEHVMLVDLGRNDLGRVCRAGSVEVGRFLTVERFSHVMHLVSTVAGEVAVTPRCQFWP